MKINGTPSPEVSSATTKNVRESAPTEAITSAKSAPAETAAPPKRRDSVEISDAGRAMASSGMSADRVNEVRQRILAGAYNAAEVVDTVARRILQRGDV